MAELTSKERVRRVAGRQHGLITGGQLAFLEIPGSTIHTWKRNGDLVRVLPKVYAVGHTTPSREADLWAAILYAGPGAMLSHGTAAHWRGLIIYPPHKIEVTTSRKIKPIAGIRVYGQRQLSRDSDNGLPVTTVPQTLIDLAGTQELEVVRRALSVLDYRGQLDYDAFEAMCGPGRRGAARLRQALKRHEPEIARTNGNLEMRFLRWCEKWDVPVPQFNRRIHGIQVDAHWPGTKLVVELDGSDNHRSKAQLHKDMTNDLTLRRHGLTVHRYGWTQLGIQGPEIRDEILDRLRVAGTTA